MRWPKTFNRVATGSLAILLSSCTSIKAPKTLFITFAAPEETFKSDTRQIRSFLDTYTKAFQRSNPETNIVYISYTYSQFYTQIEGDSKLSLGPDLIITNPGSADELLERDLTTTLPEQDYFDSIYSPTIQSIAKTNAGYTFAPWLIDPQIACFNKAKIETSPETAEELQELSARGKKIGLASNSTELIWTAGTQGAISELSTLGDTMTSRRAYPGIKAWLEWLQTAALYQNISFHKDSRELGTKLKNNELDWVTCRGSQLEDLKLAMGDNLGVGALPNGTNSRAFPSFRIYGFSLGKNSSPTQRRMAMKFIRTDVNNIAQRKLQLDNIGYLAANKNVSVPPESSRILSVLNTSFNEQSKSYQEERTGLSQYLRQTPQLDRTIKDLINGYLDTDEVLRKITTPQTE